MALDLRYEAGVAAEPSPGRDETLRRAEEALQRAYQWADWMRAAEDAQQGRGNPENVQTVRPPHGRTA